MKKTLFLLLVLIAVLSTVYLIINKDDAKMESLKSERDFKVPADEVTKIVVAEKSNRVTTLEREDDHWVVNDKYKASPDAMTMLLEAISKIRMQYIPPTTAYENIMDEFARLAFKVMVYTDDGLAKSYYIGGVSQDERATYYLMDGSKQPYAMELPFMDGSPRLRFVKDIDYWRDKAIFNYDKKNIKKVTANYPADLDKSFVIEVNRGKYELKPFEGGQLIEKPTNQKTIDKYLDNISSVYSEAFVNDHELKDSVYNHVTPFVIFTIEDKNGSEREAKLYTYNDLYNDPDKDEGIVERYYGWLTDEEEGKDFIATQHRMVKGILWTYPQFYF